MAKTRKKSGTLEATGSAARFSSGDPATLDPTRVATRAYELYLARGGGEGLELEDWLSAERELVGAGDRRGDG